MTKPQRHYFSAELINALMAVQERYGAEFFVSGGTIRDQILRRIPKDLDITVTDGAVRCCQYLMTELGGGAFVMLGTKDEEAARVVWNGVTIDFSSFRKGAVTIGEELTRRDFTVNALAVPLADWSCGNMVIHDPLGGKGHLRKRLLVPCPEAFEDDPLRMLRGYRLQAELGFAMTSACKKLISQRCTLITHSAAERILHELDRIMSTSSAASVIGEMAETGLLWVIFPELKQGVGAEQPPFHHKDVFHHNLLALESMERVLEEPQNFFSGAVPSINKYLLDDQVCRVLRWSALFHDLGKPATSTSEGDEKGRITFHNHDRVGREMFEVIAERLRMSKALSEKIGQLIEMHMHPFHLSNVRKKEQLSRRALLKICKKAGDDLIGLFILAMADTLAGQGPLKPEDMEEQIGDLFTEVNGTYEEYIKPVVKGDRLLNGHDLITTFKLSPGPQFSRIFNALEIAQVEQQVTTREEAVAWLGEFLQNEELNT